MTRRRTTAQALVEFLARQHVERDGVEQPFFAGVFGIFGHGNVAGVGQALQQQPADGALPYYLARNEQGMVHAASGFAKASNRLRTMACTSSIGPGATNMVTGAALATINRLPVLLLPGDQFASRRPDPVLQQLEQPWTRDVSVNDTFRPVSRYWDRIDRPEQLAPALLEAMRVLTDQADTGAVTLALPQDVQAEAFDFAEELFARRVWHIGRPLPDEAALRRAVELLRSARRPLVVAGGGAIYAEATEALRRFAERTGTPVGETQAGKGALPYDHPRSLGGIGVTGTRGANLLAREADVVIGVGTRYDDFTTASKTAFQDPAVRFVNVNVSAMDAHKLGGLPLVGDARATLEALTAGLEGWHADEAWTARAAEENRAWDEEVSRLYGAGDGPLPSQAEVIGAVNDAAGPRDVVVNAAGSMPGDLHKLWRARDPKGYHLEYGYSCMGYEIPGGLGVKLADPTREVFVLIGDGSWLMLSSELVTALQENVKLVVVLVDNKGFASIGALSRSVGSGGFGTAYSVEVDFEANARSLGAHAVRVAGIDDLREALAAAKASETTSVIVVETDRTVGVPSYESWWDVPIAEVSEMAPVAEARRGYDEARRAERDLLGS